MRYISASLDPRSSRLMAVSFGLAAFALYLATAGPALVPFRDAGEMTTSASTLGIIHPTGYPLYSLLGRLATRLPVGNPAYRMNVLSGLVMAGAWSLAYLFFAGLTESALAAGGAVLLGACSYQFWAHSLVAEMYTLNICFLAGLLLSVQRRQWALAAFLSGLGLGNRADLLLALPAVILLGWASRSRGDRREAQEEIPWRMILASGIFGLSVYAYLPIRASQRPWMNWNDPSTLESFLRSLLRKGYGGTLDLLSTSYQSGDNFLSEFRLYANHLWHDFAYVGIPLALWGVWTGWRRDRRGLAALLMGWMLTGPVFIYLGNLPPNPHAVAIVESGYLMPDLFVLGLSALGLAGLGQFSGVGAGLVLCLFPLVVNRAAATYEDVNRRHNFLAFDFARNVYRTLPPKAFVVARSDVPIFSLYYGHWVDPRASPDRWPFAQGLMGSPWYQRMMSAQLDDLNVMALKNGGDWNQISRLNPGRLIAATPDIDWPADSAASFGSKGVVSYLEGSAAPESWKKMPPASFFDLYGVRGRSRTPAYRDFFSREIVEEYAKAWARQGSLSLHRGQWAEAQANYQNAFRYEPELPYAVFEYAYSWFAQGRYPEAEREYARADRQMQKLAEQAHLWKSLRPIPEQIRRDRALVLAQWGVTLERLGKLKEAQARYEQALNVDPECADGRYNLAVLFWRQKNWNQAVDQLKALGQAHPEDARWRQYLPAALEHQRRGK